MDTPAPRAYDSANGMLPVVLLTPVPSPMGDLSSLTALLWQAESLLLPAGIGGASAVRLLLAGAVVAALLVVGLRRRLRRL